VTIAAFVSLAVVVSGPRNLLVGLDVISVDAVIDSVRLMRLSPVRPDSGCCTVFLWTYREADEVCGSIRTLSIFLERYFVSTCRVALLFVSPFTSMIFIRDRSVSDLATVGVDVSVFPRVDALPRTSNVVSDLTVEKRVSGVVPAGLDERDSILLTTLDGVAFADSRVVVGVVFSATALAVLVDDVFPGVIVRVARLLAFVLTVEDVLVWTGAAREATSTVRFTG
jgi:hypothetical protein